MTCTKTDIELLRIVQMQINTGATRIELPGQLVAGASEEALVEIRRLCQLNGVRVEIRM